MALLAPVFQEYEVAPDAVRVRVPPGQVVALVTLRLGWGLTKICTVAWAVQLPPLLPVTDITVVVGGLNAMVEVFRPLDQV